MNNQRCLSIVHSIRDYLYAINTELLSDYQDGEYLMSKLETISQDANVLKREFEYLQKEQNMKKGE